uniref:Phorbol-ester/DAG-type domain-containing protein n=1 Tax=Macrostomum lignano TaxID=282301 RepID=A0A1I8FEZ6_9PLAT
TATITSSSLTSYTSPTFLRSLRLSAVRPVPPGLKCESCDMNVHKRCERNVPACVASTTRSGRGRIQLQVHLTGQRLRIEVVEGKNLARPWHPNGLADPYVKLKLVSGRLKLKKEDQGDQSHAEPGLEREGSYCEFRVC